VDPGDQYDREKRLHQRAPLLLRPRIAAVTALRPSDGWNPISEYRVAEYAGQSLQKTYLRGMKLSGSFQVATGVGGLLATRVHGTAAAYYPAYDGDGCLYRV
jgi:hypothetical protein